MQRYVKFLKIVDVIALRFSVHLADTLRSYCTVSKTPARIAIVYCTGFSFLLKIGHFKKYFLFS
jgi:hypothetical protein